VDRKVTCLKCGAMLVRDADKCGLCGGPLSIEVELKGQQMRMEQGQLGTVAREPFGSAVEIRVTSPGGAESVNRLDGGSVSGDVRPPVEVGLRGEDRVRSLVLHRLRIADASAALEKWDDRSGEDGKFQVGSEQILLQIVAAQKGLFWQSVSKGRGSFDASTTFACDWLHEAIAAKASHYDPVLLGKTLLAVDAGHLGVLTEYAIVKSYLAQHGDPIVRFGFGAVWIVGPTELQIAKLGQGRW
jgi:hypothetical protein